MNRATLIRNLPTALAVAEATQQRSASGQDDLFGLGGEKGDVAPAVEPEIVEEYDLRTFLEFERQTLGLYWSSHPIEVHAPLIESVCSGRLGELIAAHAQPPAVVEGDDRPAWQPRTRVMFAAWVSDVRFFRGRPDAEGRAARPSYKITFEDRHARIGTWIDIDPYQRDQELLKPDQLVFVVADMGSSSARDGREPEPRLYAPEFISLDTVHERYLSRLSLRWRRPASEVARLHRLLEGLRREDGARLVVEVSVRAGLAVLEFPEHWQLGLGENVLHKLREWLGPECVECEYRRYAPPVSEKRSRRGFSQVYEEDY